MPAECEHCLQESEFLSRPVATCFLEYIRAKIMSRFGHISFDQNFPDTWSSVPFVTLQSGIEIYFCSRSLLAIHATQPQPGLDHLHPGPAFCLTVSTFGPQSLLSCCLWNWKSTAFRLPIPAGDGCEGESLRRVNRRVTTMLNLGHSCLFLMGLDFSYISNGSNQIIHGPFPPGSS